MGLSSGVSEGNFTGKIMNSKTYKNYQINQSMEIYDPVLIQTAAWLSLIAYYPHSKIKSLINKELSISPSTIRAANTATRRTDTDFFIFNTDDSIVICFRGSEPASFRDWITTDFDHELTNAFGIGHTQVKVHSGFITALNSAWNTLYSEILRRWDLLKRTNGKNPRILITGHSLGGALANLTAATVARSMEEAVGKEKAFLKEVLSSIFIHTFGQPRVGDIDFRDWYNSFNDLAGNTYRHVNNHDIIPRVPPREANIWFRFFDPHWIHVGSQWFYDKNGQVERNSHHRDVLDLFLLNHIPKPRAIYQSVIDHMPWRYLWAAEGLTDAKPRMSRRMEELNYLTTFFKVSASHLIKPGIIDFMTKEKIIVNQN